jgi:hypothetical protein
MAMPSACVISGGCVDAGLELALACDYRVVVDKPLTIQSVNGPGTTTIRGDAGVPIRCVYLASGTLLSGFTLTGGSTLMSFTAGPDKSGGGVYCESFTAVVSNCVLSGNSAYEGGAAHFGTDIRSPVLSSSLKNFRSPPAA